MLRLLRIFIAVIAFAAVTSVFIDFTGTAAGWFGFLPKYQLIPALLALNTVAILVLTALTLLFGRVYCSVICPLGIFQDIINRLRLAFTPARKRKPGVFRSAQATMPCATASSACSWSFSWLVSFPCYHSLLPGFSTHTAFSVEVQGNSSYRLGDRAFQL